MKPSIAEEIERVFQASRELETRRKQASEVAAPAPEPGAVAPTSGTGAGLRKFAAELTQKDLDVTINDLAEFTRSFQR